MELDIVVDKAYKNNLYNRFFYSEKIKIPIMKLLWLPMWNGEQFHVKTMRWISIKCTPKYRTIKCYPVYARTKNDPVDKELNKH